MTTVNTDFVKYSEAAKQNNFNGVVLATASDDDLSELFRWWHPSTAPLHIALTGAWPCFAGTCG